MPMFFAANTIDFNSRAEKYIYEITVYAFNEDLQFIVKL